MAVETIGADTSVTSGTTVTPNASANTKGSWAQLSASTSANCDGFIACVFGSAGVLQDYLIDIGTGGAGSETVIVNNLPKGTAVAGGQLSYHYIPLPIAAGTRVAARCQSSIGGGNGVGVILYLLSTSVGLDDCSSIVTYGAATGDSGGTNVDPGGTIHTKGSYSQITASTSADIKYIIPMFQGQANGDRSNATWLVDIATGGAGAESVVIANLIIYARLDFDIIGPPTIPPLPVTIASGTRIAVRAQCNINDATDRTFDFIMVSANGTASGGGGAHFSASFMG